MDLSLRSSLTPESRDWRMASLTHCRIRGSQSSTGVDLSLKEVAATSTLFQRRLWKLNSSKM
ncbi:uncharacterized protein CLUP02_11893 [Colletotrichum lupini]|uniref:Uncharacterized protein n=1 Tax=Colletotrichum lupini TaxID=145971 RepID=A0A9Q8WKQ9_9PEZI|nr:uncharacterized protein CLUP02_11893 [Colletotrichum lupini]UQC86392.1 hypothetical protein CLUP02_11893 [Colletotrichum lupini]